LSQLKRSKLQTRKLERFKGSLQQSIVGAGVICRSKGVIRSYMARLAVNPLVIRAFLLLSFNNGTEDATKARDPNEKVESVDVILSLIT
jgi:hypothetical protein